MRVFELYSARRKAEVRAGQPDVFQYDKVPAKLRTQFVHVCRDAIGVDDAYQYDPDAVWGAIHNILMREKGLLSLVPRAKDYRSACEQWFLEIASDEDAVDFIEAAASVIERVLGELDDHGRRMRYEMNYRLLEAGLGFQYENGALVRLDNRSMRTWSSPLWPCSALTNLTKPMQIL
jgi:hypothetical protein